MDWGKVLLAVRAYCVVMVIGSVFFGVKTQNVVFSYNFWRGVCFRWYATELLDDLQTHMNIVFIK